MISSNLTSLILYAELLISFFTYQLQLLIKFNRVELHLLQGPHGDTVPISALPSM